MKQALLLLAALLMVACEKPLNGYEEYGNVTLTFTPTNMDSTRGTTVGSFFTKLNVMLFDEDGNKVLSQVKTQTADDSDNFGTLSMKLAEGTYWVVAVGHSSKISATIKSTEAVQFTASNGEKLTDTFCHCSKIQVGDEGSEFSLTMYRVGAMVQFAFQDETVPENFAQLRIDYTGGSANFNPTTLEGITKSSQSETRTASSAQVYQAFTFPYLSKTGVLKMTVSALDDDGDIIRQREFPSVPVTRNRITTYKGVFFGEGDGEFTQSDFGFVVHGDWDGEDTYTF